MTERIRTHYDNLKVARTATDEEIRKSYRSLASTYHPDKRPGDANAARIMVLINQAYETLADPFKRANHDAWIRKEESKGNGWSSDTPVFVNDGFKPHEAYSHMKKGRFVDLKVSVSEQRMKTTLINRSCVLLILFSYVYLFLGK